MRKQTKKKLKQQFLQSTRLQKNLRRKKRLKKGRHNYDPENPAHVYIRGRKFNKLKLA